MTTHPVSPTARRAIASRRAPIAAALLAALALLMVACSTDGGDRPPAAPATEPSEPVDGLATQAASGDAGAEPTEGAASVATTAPGADDLGASDADLAASLAELAGADSATLVEDWAAYATADEVEGAIGRNLGMGANAMTLTLQTSGLAPDLEASTVDIAYAIGAAAPHDFVGFDRRLEAPADWTGARAVALWIDAAGAPGADLVFQFREGSGEVWRYQGSMPEASAGEPVLLALDAERFSWATWSRESNGAIDLEAIDQYGVYVGHAGPGLDGVLLLGPIAVVR